MNTIQYNTIQTCLFVNHTVHCIIAVIIQFDQKKGRTEEIILMMVRPRSREWSIQHIG